MLIKLAPPQVRELSPPHDILHRVSSTFVAVPWTLKSQTKNQKAESVSLFVTESERNNIK